MQNNQSIETSFRVSVKKGQRSVKGQGKNTTKYTVSINLDCSADIPWKKFDVSLLTSHKTTSSTMTQISQVLRIFTPCLKKKFRLPNVT